MRIFVQDQGTRKKLPQAYGWYRSLAVSLTGTISAPACA